MKKSRLEQLSQTELQKIVDEATTYTNLLDTFGYTDRTSGYKRIRFILDRLNIVHTHLEKQAKYSERNKASGIKRRKYKIEELLIENPPQRRKQIKNILIRDSILPYKCNKCGNDGFWNNQALVLQLEHKNGISTDYRLHNLELLCPNCHSQTETFAGRNIKKQQKIIE